MLQRGHNNKPCLPNHVEQKWHFISLTSAILQITFASSGHLVSCESMSPFSSFAQPWMSYDLLNLLLTPPFYVLLISICKDLYTFFSPPASTLPPTHTHTSSHFLFLSVSFWHKDKVTVASVHCSEATASCGELHATLSHAHHLQDGSLAIAIEKLRWSSKEVICPAQGQHNQDKQSKDATALLAQ